jgi:hypothetical protein
MLNGAPGRPLPLEDDDTRDFIEICNLVMRKTAQTLER